MYPYARAAARLFGASRKSRLGFFDEITTHHRAWPTDTDIFGELNNGRILTLFEMGRWEMTMRMGLGRLVLREGFGFAVAGVSVRYRRRIPTWSRYHMKTRLLGWDERFMYVDQSMWRGDEACSQLLLRAAFMHKGKSVAPQVVTQKLGVDAQSPALPDWVANWIEADATRPWPPQS